MKLNEIDFDLMSNNELILICLKYKIIEKEQINSKTRKDILLLIKNFIKKKITNLRKKRYKIITS